MTSDWRRLSTSKGRPNENLAANSTFLVGRAFLLDIENRNLRTRVAEGIQNSGGEIIDSFDDRDPNAVVSDHPIASKLEKRKKEDIEAMDKEKLFKNIPALLRQAVSKGIKIRTPHSFLTQMDAYLTRKGKTTSATTSNSTIRGKPSLGRENSAKVEKARPIAPAIPRRSSDQTSSRPKTERAFLRIDVPGKRPDIRFVDKNLFSVLHTGKDAGFSVFKAAEPTLVEKRQREFELFLNGKYEPAKKHFKLDERDNYCQICVRAVTGDKKEHERTDEHRYKLKTQKLPPELERVVLEARLRTQRQENHEKRRQKVLQENNLLKVASKRAGVEYEYGENEMKANWETIGRRNKTTAKTIDPSPRRRQERIQTTQQ